MEDDALLKDDDPSARLPFFALAYLLLFLALLDAGPTYVLLLDELIACAAMQCCMPVSTDARWLVMVETHRA